MKTRTLLQILLLSSVGCVQAPEETWVPVNPTDSRVLAESLQDVDVRDLEVLYKQYSGLSSYMRNANKSIDSTLSLEKTISRFQSDYSYTPGRYPRFSEAFEKYMSSRGYNTGDTSKSIVDRVSDPEKEIAKTKVIEDMQTVADGIRLAIENKNAKPK